MSGCELEEASDEDDLEVFDVVVVDEGAPLEDDFGLRPRAGLDASG